MTRQSALIATLCGLLTAVLFLLPLTAGMFGLLASSFVAAPLFVSALGFGTYAGILSGFIAAVAVAFFYNPLVAAALALVTAAPAIWIGHLAGLSRDEGFGEEWFPSSAILNRMALIAAATTILFGWFVGYDADAATEQLRAVLVQVIPSEGPGAMSEEELVFRAEGMVAIFPFVFPVSVLFMLVVNLAIAERFTRKRGWILRPAEDYAETIGLPLYSVAVLAVAAAFSLFDTSFGLAAKAVAGAFGGAFVLVGLATVHVIVRTMPTPFQMPTLIGTYLALLVSRFFGVGLALLGVFDTVGGIRARLLSSSNIPTPKD